MCCSMLRMIRTTMTTSAAQLTVNLNPRFKGAALFVLGFVLVAIGAVGFFARSIQFVWVTIPGNYGSNPGFGAYESMVLPWFMVSAVGLGVVLGSWRWLLLAIVVGPFALAIIGQLLGRLFRR